ncbi:hypothetical protein EYC80_006766 [Monilinia laxa]|uniref:Uncharacterized protein n=1 Tax=Monilinia laxa TaxID=61186 RepID=A0A5N6JZ38_MONLA|nr:hypothetical protein EYC80_006766 [Monilinia laxa]
MGNKNAFGNTKLSINHTAGLPVKKTVEIFPKAAAKPKYKPKPVVQLSTLSKHPAIEITNNKEISIYIEMCSSMPEEPTDMPSLRAALTEYKSIKKLSIKIHAPWPRTESRVHSIKKLFAIINAFRLNTLKTTMSIDGCNFPQMKLAAAVHALSCFKKWQSYYQVYDEVNKLEDDRIKIAHGSEFDLRLRGVYKKEFLTSV